MEPSAVMLLLEDLPIECLVEVLGHCTEEDLCRVAPTSRAAKKKVTPVRTGRSEAPCRHARISLGYGVVSCLFRVARALRPRHLLAGGSIERLPRPRRRRAVSVRTRKRHDIAPSACMSASHRARRGPLIASRGVTSPSQVACGVFTADCKIKASEIIPSSLELSRKGTI